MSPKHGLFIALYLIQGQNGDTEGMENSGWRTEKGRDAQYTASELQLEIGR